MDKEVLVTETAAQDGAKAMQHLSFSKEDNKINEIKVLKLELVRKERMLQWQGE